MLLPRSGMAEIKLGSWSEIASLMCPHSSHLKYIWSLKRGPLPVFFRLAGAGPADLLILNTCSRKRTSSAYKRSFRTLRIIALSQSNVATSEPNSLGSIVVHGPPRSQSWSSVSSTLRPITLEDIPQQLCAALSAF